MLKLIDKVLTTAQKAETMAKLKDAIVSIQRHLDRPVGLIVIEEKSSDVGSEVWECLSRMLPECIG